MRIDLPAGMAELARLPVLLSLPTWRPLLPLSQLVDEEWHVKVAGWAAVEI